jgi:hypothetical protein
MARSRSGLDNEMVGHEILRLTFTQPQGACDNTSGCNGNVSSLTPVGASLYVGGDVTSYRGAPAYFFFPVDATTGALLDP